jgi:hypothetical protein
MESLLLLFTTDYKKTSPDTIVQEDSVSAHTYLYSTEVYTMWNILMIQG